LTCGGQLTSFFAPSCIIVDQHGPTYMCLDTTPCQHGDTNGNCTPLLVVPTYVNIFLCERVIAPWNSLKIMPDTVQFVAIFRSLDNSADLSGFLHLHLL